MRLGKLNLFSKRQMIDCVGQLHIAELEVMDVELSDGEALAGSKVKTARHSIHLQVPLDATAFLKGIFVCTLVFSLALLDLVHLDVPLAQPVGIKHLLAGVAAAVKESY